MSISLESPPAPPPRTLSRALRVGSAALVDICRTMFCIELEPCTEPGPLDVEGLHYAGCLTLFHEGGSWELGLYGDDATTLGLVRGILMMEPDEKLGDAEVLDALGEVVNMVAGAAKEELISSARGELNITQPSFLLGDVCQDHLPLAIATLARGFRSDTLPGDLFLSWREYTPASVLEEIAATLESRQPDDKLAMSQVISYFQDLEGWLPPDTPEEAITSVQGCEAVVTEVVNDQIPAPEGIAAVATAVEFLRRALDPSDADVDLGDALDPRVAVGAAVPQTKAPAPLERDEETIELLVDFLRESEDGLEEVDGILMAAENEGADQEAINSLFRSFHSMKGMASFLELTDSTTLGHTTETLLAKVRDGEFKLAGQVLDLIFDSTAEARVLHEILNQAIEQGTEIPPHPPLAGLIENLKAAIAGEAIETGPRQEAPEPQAPSSGSSSGGSKAKRKEVLKIDLALVDELEKVVAAMTESGTLVAEAETHLGEAPDPVRQAVGDIEGFCSRLRIVSARMRMVSMRSLFQKMTRMVRDISKKTEKLTKVAVDGEETEVPRKVVEGLGDPLVHMIRNAVDHGIEEQAERAATGKSPLATIRLAAFDRGDEVAIEISEDGRGMDGEFLLKRAIEKEIVEEGTELAEGEIYALVFAPGFSTAAKVTDISGRGVGMDVVRRNIEGMGGRIEIESNLGQGTTFRLILPIV
jgi:signal transduction histidine kinase